MPTTFLVDDATNTPFTSGSAGVQVVVGTATSINGSPVGALAGLVGNFALDTSTNTLWACTASGTSGSAQWEQVLTDPSLYALINGSSGQVFNVADATQDSEAVNLGQLTDESLSPSFGSGSFSGQLSIPDATANSSAINYGQAFQLLSGAPPSSITVGNTLRTVAQYTLTTASSVTLNPGSVIGQEVIIYGGAYALTVNSNVTSGSPFFTLPDWSNVYTWAMPAGYGQGIKLDWDGQNWRAQTFGQTVVAPATEDNQAPQLSQLFIGNRKAVFTANGTWTVPRYVSTIWVSGCAGGGGGGGGGGTVGSTGYVGGGGGGGGGAGQPTIKQAISVTGGNTLSISIGGAGAGGVGGADTGTSGSAGTAGGNTVLTDSTSSTTLLTLTGGSGGSGGVSQENTSAAVPAGRSGGGGGSGYPAGSFGSDGNYTGNGGDGASGPFGGGGGRGRAAYGANFNGNNAYGYGSGGGGGGAAYGTLSGTGSNGGAGAPGFLVIEW